MKIAIALLFVAVFVAAHRARHGYRHHLKTPLPPYTNIVGREAKEDYLDIYFNLKLSRRQQKRLIEKWAQKHGILEEVKRFNAEMEKNARKARTGFTMRVDEVIPTLPIALKNYTTVMDNQDLPIEEMIQKMQAMEAEHPEAYLLLKFVMARVMAQLPLHDARPYPHEGSHSPHGDERHGEHDLYGPQEIHGMGGQRGW
ncbi:hypothetical protein COOONC_14773 [Cooperia oncophora]